MSTESSTFDGQIARPDLLQAWFDSQVPGRLGPLTLTQIRGGTSNAMFRVERNGETYALRRPPKLSNDPSANNIRREIQLLTALGKIDVPHPRLIAASLENDIVGTPFAVLEWVDGFTPISPYPEPYKSDPAMRREMGLAVVDALAAVANVDWRAVGLESFGKPDGFLERQVDRWMGQLERYRTRDLPHLDALASWLRGHVPATPRTGLIHGDYSLANVMISRTGQGTVARIVDWEMSTIGDPLLDLGHLLSGWEDADSGSTWANFADYTGFPGRREAAERYAAATGLPLDHFDYYMVLAMFRLALILEGAHARYAAGKSTLPEHALFEALVPRMLTQAATLAGIA